MVVGVSRALGKVQTRDSIISLNYFHQTIKRNAKTSFTSRTLPKNIEWGLVNLSLKLSESAELRPQFGDFHIDLLPFLVQNLRVTISEMNSEVIKILSNVSIFVLEQI